MCREAKGHWSDGGPCSHLIFTRAAKQFGRFLYRHRNISSKEKGEEIRSSEDKERSVGRGRKSKETESKGVEKILIKIHDKQLGLLANGGKALCPHH